MKLFRMVACAVCSLMIGLEIGHLAWVVVGHEDGILTAFVVFMGLTGISILSGDHAS